MMLLNLINFWPSQVREHPLYHLIKAQAKKKMGELTEAIQTLQMAMSLPGVRKRESLSKSKSRKMELSPADCVSVFLELADALWLNGEQVSFYILLSFFSGFKHLTHAFNLTLECFSNMACS